MKLRDCEIGTWVIVYPPTEEQARRHSPAYSYNELCSNYRFFLNEYPLSVARIVRKKSFPKADYICVSLPNRTEYWFFIECIEPF